MIGGGERIYENFDYRLPRAAGHRSCSASLRRRGCAIGPLPERLRKATVIPVDVDELDITDREAAVNYIRRHQPDTVINCAAFTNVDGCETASRCGVQGQRPRPRAIWRSPARRSAHG